jgi:hypothetical protein
MSFKSAMRTYFVSFQTMGIDTVFSTGLPSSVAGSMRCPCTALKHASSKRGKPEL